VLDGTQAGGYADVAVGDEVAVGSATGAFGQVLAGCLDLAKVGFAFCSMSGDGVDGDVRGDGVQDERRDLTVRVMAGQNGDERVAGIELGLPGAMPVLVAEVGEHEVGAVHLVAGGAEVMRDRAEVGAARAVARVTIAGLVRRLHPET